MLQLFACSFIQIGSKLREGCQLTILGKCQTDTATQFFNYFGLRSTTYARYRNTGINRRTDTGVKQVGFQENLTVGNRNYVCRYECRDVAGLRFNNRQCSQRACFALHFAISQFFNFVLIYTCSTLQQAGVQIENVARICFTTGRTAQQQGNLTVSNSLFGQVIIYNQCVFTAVAEELAHSTTCIRCDILQSRSFRSGRSNHNRVLHCTMLFQFAYYVSNGRCFLTDCNINTNNARTFLVDNSIQCYGCFTCLTVTNDQLTLTATNRNH